MSQDPLSDIPGEQVPVEEPAAGENDALQAVLSQLSVLELRWVIARQETINDQEASKLIGIKPSHYYNWDKDRRQLMDHALRLIAQDGVMTALELRRRVLAKAMAVKASGLNSKDERIRQAAATEIIEWELGRAKAQMELDVKVEEKVLVYIPDNGRQ